MQRRNNCLIRFIYSKSILSTIIIFQSSRRLMRTLIVTGKILYSKIKLKSKRK